MEQVHLLSKNLRRINNLYNKILLNELSTLKLDQHFEALLVLGMQDKPITQNTLAELLRTDKSRIVNIVYELGERGLINSTTNPDDRREHYISLSDKAEKLIPAIAKAVEKTNQLAVTGIKKEKLLAFMEVSELIERNLYVSVDRDK
jgi:DNA-binding MarR family transcriptional regulator